MFLLIDIMLPKLVQLVLGIINFSFSALLNMSNHFTYSCLVPSASELVNFHKRAPDLIEVSATL